MSTPIRRQYLELKARYPDTILFFRLGDFYETFDDDAKLVARELQITLTSKVMGKDLRVPLAGVPYHSIDNHIAKLVSRGYRAAICEQMAEPDEVKVIVPRDVVRVVTSGTVTADASLEAAAPNYLAALVIRRGEAGLALADITTGEIRLARGGEALDELMRSAPAELLLEDALDRPPNVTCPVLQRPIMGAMEAGAELAKQFGDQAESALVDGQAEAAALAHILVYLREVYPASLGPLQRVRAIAPGESMALDARTLRNLDVFSAFGKEHSLYRVLNTCQSPMGARLLRIWLTHPLREPAALGARHDAVEWAVTYPIEREQARALMSALPDIGRLTGKVGSRTATPRDLHALRLGFRATLDLAALLRRSVLPVLLDQATAQLAAAAEPLILLDAALDPDPPLGFDEGGVINPGFSPEIDSLRAMTRDARGYLLALERTERERSAIKTLKIGHNRVFGYYIEVSASQAHLVPADYQRRQTLAGAERYVTDALKEHESNLISARERFVELERQAFASLVESLFAVQGSLQAVADAVAACDLALALGEVASLRGYTRPHFRDDTEVRIIGGRHPSVEDALGAGRFVPNDCVLDAGCQVLILTGPNMSGKSTYLRQVALIALMAQAGSFVPAAEAQLPLFDRIFTRIGAQDDLAAGQSTFMVEMVETAQILHQATPRSLVILDEVGRGTSTFDGMAIARAVVEFLHNRKELAARTLFATHYHELTALEGILPRVRNAHVAVQETGNDVVFEHRIVPGPSDRSYGIHVARLAGLPASVITRAEHLLGELEANGRAARNGATMAKEPVVPVLQPSFFAANEPSAVEAALAAIEIDELTPLEAIQRLYELRALANARGGQA